MYYKILVDRAAVPLQQPQFQNHMLIIFSSWHRGINSLKTTHLGDGGKIQAKNIRLSQI